MRCCGVVTMLVVLGLAAPAAAQPPVVVRAVFSAMGGSDVPMTGQPGVGVGVELNEYVEAFGEFTQAVGLEYPPEAPHATSGFVGVPVTFVIALANQSHYDRLLLGGVRLSTSREAPIRLFAEVGGGLMRRRTVLSASSFFPSQTETDHQPVGLGGGGVAGRVRRFEVEAGYRIGFFNNGFYERIEGVHAAVGVRF